MYDRLPQTDVTAFLMAPISIMFLLFFLNSIGARAQSPKPKLIELGSSLSPTTSSWVSLSGHFAFGFYRLGTGFAVGIWLVGQSENFVVWTANRDDPPVSLNATLEFTRNGKLLLRRGSGEETPIANVTESAASASMLDSGNFVLFPDNSSHIIWQSFENPTDTLLGGQNLSTGDTLASSKTGSDHATGGFYLTMTSLEQIISYPMGVPEDSYWTVDARDLNEKGLLSSYDDSSYVLTLASNISSDAAKNETIIYRATLDVDGVFRLYYHSFGNSNSSTVSIKWQAFENQCDVKGLCGVNGLCSSTGTNANCSCVPGFVSINPELKYLGCYRSFNNEEECRGQEPELLYNITTLRNVSWGGDPYSVLRSLNEQDCNRSCLQDCNCWAAYYLNGICRRYKLPLVYGIASQNESGITFLKMSLGTAYVGNHNLPVPRNQTKVIESNKKELILVLASSLGSIAFLCALFAVSSFFIYRSQVHRYRKLSENAMEEFTLRSFSYNDLEKATDGFREELGRGPFGAVYKGTIAQGTQTIAVKRLEKVVEEGEREFQAEMTIIGRTHHRNLVRLLGFCMQGSRKLLVYEYMINGSLADLLFNGEKRPIWRERVRIALDVARGIFYLHEECEVRIIHGNIKPKNILLDDSWTAKLSDFRLARLLRPNQTGTIFRLRGSTGGYSGPEQQKRMLISVEADVYSFGVVLLEIVCCRSNLDINVSTGDEILLCSWVYSCFVGRELEKLVGDEEVDMKTLERMVKVGLLCIQDDPSLRPTMKNVILMLEGTMDVPIPPSPFS